MVLDHAVTHVYSRNIPASGRERTPERTQRVDQFHSQLSHLLLLAKAAFWLICSSQYPILISWGKVFTVLRLKERKVGSSHCSFLFLSIAWALWIFRRQMFESLIRIVEYSQFKAQAYPISVYVSDIPELYSITLPTLFNRTFSFGANLSLPELEVICKSISTTLGPELSGLLEDICTQSH